MMNDDFNYDNEIIEIDSENSEPTEEEVLKNMDEANEEISKEKEKRKKNKRTLKEKWHDLSKKQKITIITISIIIILLIVGLVIYFVFVKNDKNEPKTPEKPVILEKDNYRYENGKLIFLDKNDRELGSYECENKKTDLCLVAKLDYEKDKFERPLSVNEQNEELEKTSQIFYDKFVFVKDGDKTFLYNISNKEKELELNLIKTYGDGFLVVVEDTDGKYGLIKINSGGYEYLIRPSYEYLGIVNSELNYLVAEDKTEKYLVDNTGKKISKNISADIMSVNNKFIVGKVGNTYNLFDYNYNELLSDYEYIALHGEVISLVKGGRLYLVDSSLNKLYEDGLRLENNDYVKKYIYDSDNKLKEIKKSYEVSVSNNVATVTIGKEIKNINILEGSISSGIDYVSYFDGKLYFYSDIEKTDLLGTYSCINKNNVSDSNSSLANCNVFSNEKGVLGVYNNQYVFINDSKNKNEMTYYLYDLKQRKSIGTYNELEVLNSAEMTNKIVPIYTSSSFIIAKSATGSNKGNYGVLEVTSSKVIGKIAFKYESIKKEKDYYLLASVDKTYSIYDKNFGKISNEFDYIELFDEYYAGVLNKKLNIYKYNDALGILEKDIPVKENKFTIDFSNGFKITVDGVTYEYGKDGKLPVVEEGE